MNKVIDLDALQNDVNFQGFQSEFIEIFDLYDTGSTRMAQKLSTHLRDQWGIFNLKSDEIELLLEHFAPDYFNENQEMLHGLVVPLYSLHGEYQQNMGIFSGKSWSEFETVIRQKNRYHNSLMVTERLEYFLRLLVTSLEADDTHYFRSRIINDTDRSKNGLHGMSAIGPAPERQSKAGRLNAPGFSYLYLGSDVGTSLVEIRASIQDIVAVGTFKLRSPIQVVDLDKLAELSPFAGVDKMSYLINRSILIDIDKAMRRKTGRNRSEVDYVPTEYISDLIKTMGVDGMVYASSVSPTDAVDLVLFDTKKVELLGDIKLYEIEQMNFTFKKVAND
ncbi:RES family NAD+ phosphorylase [Lacticaseibacillus pantheris]|uniref:RES family NAD+ phosphorylase n=1 Tax=Lacticaseibacillus pantheris TaxID=171523 RepID=UPI00138F4468|nr:RES family NAD+ phosphorylase [Lacticaseibacillus pantheris]